MRSDRRRVVVTGMGAMTPLGLDAESSWAGVVKGVSGVGPITLFDTSDYKTTIAAEIGDWDSSAHFDKKEVRRLDRFSEFFIVAARHAIADAGLDFQSDENAASKTGVLVGAGFGGMGSFIEEIETLVERGPRRLSPTGVPRIIPNMAAGLVSIEHNLTGPVSCVVTACSASANAIGDAAELIRRGAAEIMVAGGAEASITTFGIGSFSQSRALSTRNDDPDHASRPFDVDRDGFVMGEGGAVLILESIEHAQSRQASLHRRVDRIWNVR